MSTHKIGFKEIFNKNYLSIIIKMSSNMHLISSSANRMIKFDPLESTVTRKPVFLVSDQIPHNLGCTGTEDS